MMIIWKFEHGYLYFTLHGSLFLRFPWRQSRYASINLYLDYKGRPFIEGRFRKLEKGKLYFPMELIFKNCMKAVQIPRLEDASLNRRTFQKSWTVSSSIPGGLFSAFFDIRAAGEKVIFFADRPDIKEGGKKHALGLRVERYTVNISDVFIRLEY